MDTERTVELGDKVKDEITGYEGIVIAITDWLYECRTVAIQSQAGVGLLSGAPAKAETFDEAQLVVVEKGVIKPKAIIIHPDAVDTVTIGKTGKEKADKKSTGGPHREAERAHAKE